MRPPIRSVSPQGTDLIKKACPLACQPNEKEIGVYKPVKIKV